MNIHDLEEILICLEQSPHIFTALVRSVPEAMLKIRRIPNKWSIHEHACHVIDVQPMLIERFRRFQQEERPVFIPYFPGKAVSDDYLLSLDLFAMLAKFAAYRKEMLDLVRSFRPEEFEKQAEHDEYTLYTPRILLRHILMHEHFHLYRIEELWLTKDAYLPINR